MIFLEYQLNAGVDTVSTFSLWVTMYPFSALEGCLGKSIEIVTAQTL
jgi:hypothetical protein